jgi:cation/acetate symporter
MDPIVIGIFSVMIVGIFFVTHAASKRTKTAESFYTAGGGLTARQNGLALAGDFMSASTFLGLIGAFALTGYDAFFLMYGALISFLVILFLVAEPLRNLGKFTLGDMITSRFDFKTVRLVTSVNTIVISLFYMLSQLVAAGALFQLLLGIPYQVSIIVVGIGMLAFVLMGGMTATSWVQIIKAVLLIAGTIVLFFLVLFQFDFNLLAIFAGASSATPFGDTFLTAGIKYTSGWEAASLSLGLILGTAGLPHVLVRFFTVPNAQVARKSVIWLMWILGSFHIIVIFIGLGAVSILGMDTIIAANPAGNMTAPLLADYLGGGFLFAFVTAVSFATILAVVAGIVVTASTSFSHDIYHEIIKKGKTTEKEQLKVVRIASVIVTVIAITLASPLQNFNVAFLGVLGLTFAASANLPVILLTIYWKKFNKVGAIVGMTVGLLGTILLVAASPNVWNPVEGAALLTGTPWFPLSSPGIVSIPLGFLACYVGTLIGHALGAKPLRTYKVIAVKSTLGHDLRGISKH